MSIIDLEDKKYEKWYQLGIKYKINNNYKEAIKYLKLACEHPKYRALAKDLLSNMYLEIGNLRLARSVADLFKLDIMEGNFNRNIANINSELENYKGPFPYFLLRELAINYINLGEYDLAIKIIETMLCSSNIGYYRKILLLVKVYIYMNNYEEAFKLLNGIDYAKMISTNIKYSIRFKRLYCIVCRKLGYNIGDINAYIDDYFPGSLLYQSIIIQNSYNQIPQEVYFSKGYEEGINYIREEMEKTNPILAFRSFPVDIYTIKFDDYAGVIDDEKTHYLKVLTEINTQNIVHIAPLIVSSEFDKEGSIHDESLSLVRKRGMK